MKKCLSCTKDLPDAALHCVFCGAKQPPAPASQPAMAKTAFGYSGGDELEKLRAQAASANAARNAPSPSAPPANLPAAAPYSHQAPTRLAPNPVAPVPGPSPAPLGPSPAPMGPGPGPMGPGPMGPGPMAPAGPRMHPPSSAPPPVGYAPGLHAPVAGANAPTIAAPPGQGPTPIVGSAARPHSPSQSPPVAGAFSPGGGAAPPVDLSKVGPLKPVGYDTQPMGDPYASSERPIEPWKDSLRLVMYVWGALILVAFATPLSIDPLVFNWDAIIDGEGTQKLGPLVIAAVGLLSIVVGAIPMAAGARGIIALLLGLSGVFVPIITPIAQGGDFAWEPLLPLVGMLLLVSGLLIRSRYTASINPRILVTLGALLVLFLQLVPIHGGSPPIVGLFDGFSGDGPAIVMTIIRLLAIVLVVYAVIAAWLPSPKTGGARLLAWVFILWPLVEYAAALFLLGNPEDVTDTPGKAVLWMIVSGYLAIIAYGMASFIGKSLEKP